MVLLLSTINSGSSTAIFVLKSKYASMSSYTSFLSDLADDLCARYASRLDHLTIVFPNWRAGEVFKKCVVTHLSSSTRVLPQVMSIDRFLQRHSPLKQASSLMLTHVLYQTFQTISPRKEPFEQFYFWGNLLLQDLDVIDRYLVNATHLFADLSQQKEWNTACDYLNEMQREAIQAFWSHFKQRLSAHQRDFLWLWKLLPQVYQAFRKRLQGQGIGYPGLCYGHAYEALKKGTVQIQAQQLVFAGFNALSPIEEKILAWCRAHLPTEFYWDLDDYYMKDVRQEAGMYLRAHQQRSYFRASFSPPFPQRLAKIGKAICITAVASEVGQAQVVAKQLKTLIDTQGKNFVPNKTAIVLANEKLLLPVLHALSLGTSQVNTTLGYPLQDTSTYHLLELLLKLQLATIQEDSSQGYLATQHVQAILQHPYVISWNADGAKTTLQRVKSSQKAYVAQSTLLEENDWYAVLFKDLAPPDSLLMYLIEVLQKLQKQVQNGSVKLFPLEEKALNYLSRQLNSLQDLQLTSSVLWEDFVQLFRQLGHSARLSLGRQGQDGIQVLDVLTTQNLDFDHVFIVGMNEGYFPATSNLSSFIPYNLRKAYDLPTADQHQAALYAYHFYRLLQRAQQIYITYSNATIDGNMGEMSRYLYQLLYEADLPIKRQTITPSICLTTPQPIVIHKNELVLRQLQQFVLHPDGQAIPLSPSALNTYLDCSLRFYFQYLLQLRAPLSTEHATHAGVFGKLFHEVMERLYAPLVRDQSGKLLQLQDLVVLQKKISSTIREVFIRHFHFEKKQPVKITGEEAVAKAVMTKLVNKIVALDRAYAPFELVGTELSQQVDFPLDSAQRVRLKGIIDRVDWKQGIFRVLDYKTGTDSQQLRSIASLFVRGDISRNKAAFQAFFYAWLFLQQGLAHIAATTSRASGSVASRVVPGLINTRQVFSECFDTQFFFPFSERLNSIHLENIAPHQEEWEQRLRQTLTELLDPTIPFTQVADEQFCTSCLYKGICQRR